MLIASRWVGWLNGFYVSISYVKLQLSIVAILYSYLFEFLMTPDYFKYLLFEYFKIYGQLCYMGIVQWNKAARRDATSWFIVGLFLFQEH